MSRRLLASAATLAAVASAFTIAPASAQPAAPGTVLSGYDAALTRDLGLDAAGASARWAAQERASELGRTIGARLGERFGGAWIDGDVLRVAVTDPRALGTARSAGAESHVVARSAAALDRMMSRLNGAAPPAAVTGWHVDLPTNQLVVTTTDEAAGRAFAASAAGVDPAAVRVELTTEMPRTLASVVGGNAYHMGSGGRCSVGFPVDRGFATAGHCGTRGTSTTGPTGRFDGSSFPGNDYAWVTVTGGDRPVGAVNNYKGGTVPVAGASPASTGATVCRSGSTTGWHCGRIHSFNATVSYKEGSVTGLIKTDVCAEPGDSGGSLIAGSQAQGVTSGGSGNCRSGGTTYFQPIGEILQAGRLRLLTGGRIG
ncbi:serine protease [Pilimelia terevasa]|uniref:Serine protease n=1 Tax=Pilimelia terevasa TaxID=53372 RepID=A0A8J3BJV5_9ACTN|nr:S1 family peptidase [Pilimelia terevasa]GGK27614.1 serine protease [Pilimelia terevasa]